MAKTTFNEMVTFKMSGGWEIRVTPEVHAKIITLRIQDTPVHTEQYGTNGMMIRGVAGEVLVKVRRCIVKPGNFGQRYHGYPSEIARALVLAQSPLNTKFETWHGDCLDYPYPEEPESFRDRTQYKSKRERRAKH